MRTSKATALLDERIAVLRRAWEEAASTQKAIQAQLDEVVGLRDKLERVAPKRPSRSKRVVAAPPANSTATAA
jgi:hypothetical protein